MASKTITTGPGQRSNPTVDRTALRFNQAAIITLLAIGFVVDSPWLVGFVGAVMAIGTIVPQAALFQRFYRDILRPLGLLRPAVHVEDPAPHRFAQGVGALVLLAGFAALLAGLVTLGWALTFVVIALAAVNLIFGFCAGCFMYFQLQRLRPN